MTDAVSGSGAAGELRFALCPVAELASGRICAARTLPASVPSGGELSAAEEEAALFGAYANAFSELCDRISDRLNKGLDVISTVVDLSALPCPDTTQLEELILIADSGGIPHSCIIFEFNEDFLQHDYKRARSIIANLRSRGFRTASSGDSLIAGGEDSDYIRLLNAAGEGTDADILEVARLRRIRLSADGADSREICRRLYREGFSFASGAYYGEAMSFDEFYAFYEHQREHPAGFESPLSKKSAYSYRSAHYTLLIVLSILLLLIVTGEFFAFLHYSGGSADSEKLWSGILLLSGTALFSCIIIIITAFSLRRRLTMEERRFLIMEEVSDTVLFDYDCRADYMHYSSNAAALFACGDCEQPRFLQELECKNIHPEDRRTLRSVLSCMEASEGEWRLRLLAPDGNRYIRCLVHYKYLRSGKRYSNVIGRIIDVDEQERREEKLIELSERDSLTGLLNKLSSETRIRERMRLCGSGTLFMIDIDNFRSINNSRGHDCGDRALSYIAECMRRIFRPDDILGRFGGDEMTVFIADITDRELMQRRAELLIEMLSGYSSDSLDGLSCSIGIAEYPSDGSCWNELFRAADSAMYYAKNHGKRLVCFYGDLTPGETAEN